MILSQDESQPAESKLDRARDLGKILNELSSVALELDKNGDTKVVYPLVIL